MHLQPCSCKIDPPHFREATMIRTHSSVFVEVIGVLLFGGLVIRLHGQSAEFTYADRIVGVRGDSTGLSDMPMEFLQNHTRLPVGKES